MDFVERLFHISPDGGTGLLECSVLVGSAAIGAALAVLRIGASLKRRAWRYHP